MLWLSNAIAFGFLGFVWTRKNWLNIVIKTVMIVLMILNFKQYWVL